MLTAFPVVALALSVGASHGPCYAGQLADPPVAVVGLKFFKSYSSSMREMLYKSLGQNHSYMEHHGLALFRAGGLRSLVPGGRVPLSKSPCGASRPMQKRVAFFAFLREPASRWVSMVHMLHWRRLRGVACADYTIELLEPYVNGSRRDLRTGANPYAAVLGADSFEAVPRALRALARDFVVGTDGNATEFLATLARLTGADDAGFFARNFAHEHNVGEYCSLERLPALTRGFLRGRMALDHALYRGAAEIARTQARAPRPPPAHVVRDLLARPR